MVCNGLFSFGGYPCSKNEEKRFSEYFVSDLIVETELASLDLRVFKKHLCFIDYCLFCVW